MAIPTFIPRFLSLPARIFPRKIPTAILVHAGNSLLESQQLIDRIKEIEGAKICLHITDMDLKLFLVIENGRLGIETSEEWDMRIAGTLNHFLALAMRTEDPDTLFFNRSLILEGKTEVGLYVKNLLDAVDLGVDRQMEAFLGRKPPESVSRLVTKLTTKLNKAVRSILSSS